MQTGTIDTNYVEALFDDDEDNASEATDHHNAGVALNGDRATQSGPPSPTRNGMAPQRSKSDSRILNSVPEGKLTNREKYLGYFDLREEGGNYIQDVREMTRVPVLLKTDLGKSPPYVLPYCFRTGRCDVMGMLIVMFRCLTIRSLNPYAL